MTLTLERKRTAQVARCPKGHELIPLRERGQTRLACLTCRTYEQEGATMKKKRKVRAAEAKRAAEPKVNKSAKSAARRLTSRSGGLKLGVVKFWPAPAMKRRASAVAV